MNFRKATSSSSPNRQLSYLGCTTCLSAESEACFNAFSRHAFSAAALRCIYYTALYYTILHYTTLQRCAVPCAVYTTLHFILHCTRHAFSAAALRCVNYTAIHSALYHALCMLHCNSFHSALHNELLYSAHIFTSIAWCTTSVVYTAFH